MRIRTALSAALFVPALVAAQATAPAADSAKTKAEPPAASTQAEPRTIDPGMTREQVIAAIGKPKAERTVQDTPPRTYLYYANKCEAKCGSDYVLLEGGKVIEALFRNPSRRYSAATRTLPDRETRPVRAGRGKPGTLATPAAPAKPSTP